MFTDNQSANNLSIQKDETRRPFGISLLSGVTILGSVVLLIAIFAGGNEFFSDYKQPFVPLNYIAVYLFILTIISMFSGLAAWQGKVWGWWFFVIYYFYDIIKSGKSLLLFASSGFTTVTSFRSVFYSLMGVVVTIAIISYLFQDHVFAYFNLNKNLKLRYTVSIIIGVVIFIALISFLQA